MGFIEKTRCVSQGAEIRRILDTKALRQAGLDGCCPAQAGCRLRKDLFLLFSGRPYVSINARTQGNHDASPSPVPVVVSWLQLRVVEGQVAEERRALQGAQDKCVVMDGDEPARSRALGAVGGLKDLQRRTVMAREKLEKIFGEPAQRPATANFGSLCLLPSSGQAERRFSPSSA